MMYRWREHASELELELKGETEAEVLSDALSALRELLEPEEGGTSSQSARERRQVRATGPDRPALLAAWLEELLYLAESEGFIAAEIEQLSLSGREIRATVLGSLGEPRPLVKGVTYHRLQFEAAGREYRGRVILDV